MGKRNRKVVRLPEDLVESLNQQLEEFRKKFGRDPGPNDPLFFNPNCDTPEPFPYEWAEAQIVAAMEAAGLEPELIHAFVSTGGMIVTKDNEHLWSDEDLAEWNAAIEEYRRKSKAS